MERGLYIHIPFCVRKCLYCDFVSYTGCEDIYQKYLDALIDECNIYKGMRVNTVFIGGGTPTVLSAKQLKYLITSVYSIFDISSDCEFTVESNPGTLDEEKIKTLLFSGVNRLSIGVQSFNDDDLKRIGRIHDAKTAYNTIALAKKLGMNNINADLMQSIPYQTEKSLLNNISTAISLDIEHISCYSLILEEGTKLEKQYSKGELILPSDEDDRHMYKSAVSLLEKNGYMQYEISNFAKENAQCRHNIKYWRCEEYLGVGAAAHSYINKERFFNTSILDDYLNGNRVVERISLSDKDMQSEFVFMGLRMNEGISDNEFKKRFARSLYDVYGKEIKKFLHLGLLTEKGDRISFTERGQNISNSVLCEFV